MYSAQYGRLVSAGEDSRLVCWDMVASGLETPDWATSDTCQLCSRPFFWNLRAMYDQRQVGLRQHHCRRCGKAVCDYCSAKRSVLTERGHEYPVRVCEDCFINVTEAEKRPMANFFDTRFDYTLVMQVLPLYQCNVTIAPACHCISFTIVPASHCMSVTIVPLIG